MMKIYIVAAFVSLLALTGCQKSIKGDYNLINSPVPGVVATFGDHTFSLSSGANGAYEVDGDTVILTGMTFAGTFKKEGDKLIGDQFTLIKRSR